jgi:hypothetical protein
VGYDDGRASLEQFGHAFLYPAFRCHIHAGGGLVHDYDLGIEGYSPGKGQQLFFAHGQVGAPFMQLVPIPRGRRLTKSAACTVPRAALAALLADAIVIDPDILQYGTRKQVDVLEYQAYHPPPGMQIQALKG